MHRAIAPPRRAADAQLPPAAPAAVKQASLGADAGVVRSLPRVPTRVARRGRRRCIRTLVPALVAALALGLLGPLATAPAGAAEDPDTASVTGVDRLEEVRRELAGSSEEMVRAVALMREADEALPAARAAAAKARAELADVTRRRDDAARVRGEAQSRLVQTEQEAEEAAAAARAGEDQLGRLAREAYQLGPENGLLAMVTARSPHDVNARLMQLSSLADAQTAAIRRLDVASEGYDTRLADLEVARDAFNAAHATLEAQQARAADVADKADKAEQAHTALVAQRTSALRAAEAAVAEDARRYAALAAAADRLSASVQARDRASGRRSGGSVTVRPGTLLQPVPGSITSPFGMRVHPITGVYKLHTGTDFGAACGTPVVAAAAGVVLEQGSDRAYGNRVVLGHGPVQDASLTTTYNHLSQVTVRSGQQLRRGELLGYVGSTGYSTGCHLHLEVLVGGVFANPMGWL